MKQLAIPPIRNDMVLKKNVIFTMWLNLFLDFCQYIIDQIVIKFYVSRENIDNEIVYCA
jgi:hypothetical protein